MPLNDEIKAMFGGSGDEESPNAEGTQEFAEDTTEESGDNQAEQREDEGAEDESDSEDDSLDSRYSRLLQTFNETSAKLAEYEQTRGQKQEVPITLERSAETPVSAASTDLSIDEKLLEKALIEDDPIAMKQVLMSIAAHVSSQKEVWRESVLRDLPTITRDVARQQVVLLNAVNKFYQDNDDLVPYQGVVGNVTNQIAAQHPEYSLGQLFEEVEKNVRKTLGLKRIAQRTEENRASAPAFVKKANSRKPGPPKIEGIRAEIAAMKDARR